MSMIGSIINIPTVISAGAVAAAGTSVNIGAMNSASKNITAVVNDVKPVLPPSATPADDSTNVVTVEVPSIDPTTVPIESAKKALLTLGSLPSLSSIFDFDATPASVPTVSNISTNKNVNTAINICVENTCEKSNLNAIGSTDGGSENILNPSGIVVIPIGMPMIVVIIIPNNNAPLTFLITSIKVITKPISASSAVPSVIFPSPRIVPSG